MLLCIAVRIYAPVLVGHLASYRTQPFTAIRAYRRYGVKQHLRSLPRCDVLTSSELSTPFLSEAQSRGRVLFAPASRSVLCPANEKRWLLTSLCLSSDHQATEGRRHQGRFAKIAATTTRQEQREKLFYRQARTHVRTHRGVATIQSLNRDKLDCARVA